MNGKTISHYQVLEKLGEARRLKTCQLNLERLI
jgi:hypothetical protein